MRMPNYCVEDSQRLPELVKKVNRMIQVGYRPVGGISVTQTHGSLLYHQAMMEAEVQQVQVRPGFSNTATE